MNSPRALVASALCAVFVIGLAGVQLAVNAAGGGKRGEEIEGAKRIVSTDTPAEPKKRHFVTEDMAGWDCTKMGNRQCAPGEEDDAVFPGSTDPRPLKMAGVEIHKKECPKGADARVKLMKRSAIYGHCATKEPAKKDDGPKEPKEPSTSHEKP